MNREIKTPLTKEMAKELRAGDYVTITGTIYTARDAAHKRMIEALDAGEKLPIEIDGNILYYMGPSPAREGRPIGSAGPTTASRMDKYAPRLLDLGLDWHDCQGKTERSCKRSHHAQWRRVLRGGRRSWSAALPANQESGGRSL